MSDNHADALAMAVRCMQREVESLQASNTHLGGEVEQLFDANEKLRKQVEGLNGLVQQLSRENLELKEKKA